MLAFNLFGAAEWVARSYANIPLCLRFPGQEQARFYRVVGYLLIASTAIALAWVAIRLR
jgi:hypothetical protein